MNKKVLLVGVAAMACVAMVGCGKNNSESRVVELAPGVTVIEEGNQGTMILETNPDNPLGQIIFDDPMVESAPNTAESLAEKYGVTLADDQAMITSQEGEAVVITAPKGCTFAKEYSDNCAVLRDAEGNEIYRIYDCSNGTTETELKEKHQVEDLGNGCYLQTDPAVRVFCFKDNAGVVVAYTRASSDASVDVETAKKDCLSLIEGMKFCKY